MIWLNFEKWSMYANPWFVYRRYYYKGRWTPILFMSLRKYDKEQKEIDKKIAEIEQWHKERLAQKNKKEDTQ